MESLKNTIKELAAKQIEYKNQRKTVHRVGEKILYPYPEGSYQYNNNLRYGTTYTQSSSDLHRKNRHTLRLLYATQQLLKGKTLKEIERYVHQCNMPLSHYQVTLDKLVEEYGEVAHNS